LIIAVGGPAFTAWLSPSEEEIRAKYNPDLRQRSIEGKAQREQEFDEFVTRLKDYSKSDKPSALSLAVASLRVIMSPLTTPSLGCRQGRRGTDEEEGYRRCPGP
jgi:CBP4